MNGRTELEGEKLERMKWAESETEAGEGKWATRRDYEQNPRENKINYHLYSGNEE